MRKMSLFILILLAFSLSASAAMTCVDADTVSGSSSTVRIGSNDNWRLGVVCTFDTTPGTASAAMPTTIMRKLNGSLGYAPYVYHFSTVPGSTGPTDNSDLAITDSSGATILSASGNGANVIDNATVTSVIYGDGPTPGSTNHYPKGNGFTWTIAVTNNAVNNSSFTLWMFIGK